MAVIPNRPAFEYDSRLFVTAKGGAGGGSDGSWVVGWVLGLTPQSERLVVISTGVASNPQRALRLSHYMLGDQQGYREPLWAFYDFVRLMNVQNWTMDNIKQIDCRRLYDLLRRKNTDSWTLTSIPSLVGERTRIGVIENRSGLR